MVCPSFNFLHHLNQYYPPRYQWVALKFLCFLDFHVHILISPLSMLLALFIQYSQLIISSLTSVVLVLVLKPYTPFYRLQWSLWPHWTLWSAKFTSLALEFPWRTQYCMSAQYPHSCSMSFRPSLHLRGYLKKLQTFWEPSFATFLSFLVLWLFAFS